MARLLKETAGSLVTSPLVIAEAAYLINRELGATAELALSRAIIDDALIVETLTHADWLRVRELVCRYCDLPLGGTDASLIALTERLDTDRGGHPRPPSFPCRTTSTPSCLDTRAIGKDGSALLCRARGWYT